ncbi:MAG: hypothetical protein FWF72_02255 [Paludibacter sp.]|nr:hypothetical protein [Paludibacter sp.]
MNAKNFLLMLLIVPFVFGACKKDEPKDEPQSNIVGHWNATKVVVTLLDGTVNIYDETTEEYNLVKTWFINLEADGTCTLRAFNSAVGTTTYTYNNGMLTFAMEVGDGTNSWSVKVVSVTDSQLVIDYGNVHGVFETVKSEVVYYTKAQ